MANGYTGKILRVDLTTKAISTLDTAKYEGFGGGLGIGAAIFWELAVLPGKWDLRDAFDPQNVLTFMTGPLAATGVPSAGRTNISGLAPDTYPQQYFKSGSLGGRWGNTLKMAGWDGVVVEGKAETPVWINIIDDKVTIEDAKTLWGKNTYEAQDIILNLVAGRSRFASVWKELEDGYSTQRPQIVCTGPIGEKLSRIASLVHGSGVTPKTGCWGGVFGSKNLKAICVQGSRSVHVADAKAIVDARLAHVEAYPPSLTRPTSLPGTSACMNCLIQDRARNTYYGGDSICADAYWMMSQSKPAADILQRWGLSSWGGQWGGVFTVDVPGAPAGYNKKVPDAPAIGWYIKYLYDIGDLGPGKKIDSSPLPMDQYNTLLFRELFCSAVATRTGIGDACSEGTLRAAEKWGTLERDRDNGMLRFPQWGTVFHWTLPNVEWAYASLFDAGDVCWHPFKLGPRSGPMGTGAVPWTLEQLLNVVVKRTVPYTDDPYMFSHCWQGEEAMKTGIYSEHKAKLVAWSRHYAHFWNESMAFCETIFPEITNKSREDFAGSTPNSEMAFYKAVTGKNITFTDTLEIGRKIWNLQRAIRILQGRQRDMERFFPFMYMPGASGFSQTQGGPVYKDGQWTWERLDDLYLDDAGVEALKTHFYKLEGWDVQNGWPTRKTYEELGMKNVADFMQSKGKLGTA